MTETSLGAKAARGAAFMGVAQIIRVILQMCSVVLLARLLDANDFGVVAMVTAIIGIGAVLRDFGLGQAAIQAKTLSEQAKSNLFWLNSSIGLLIAVLVAICAPLISSFYGEESLALIVLALSTTFLINGVATQFRAQLSRDLKFRMIAVTEVGAQFLGISAGLICAFIIGNYWAIVIQQVTEALILLILSWFTCKWRPKGYSRSEPISKMLHFGWQLSLTQLVVYFSQNLDSLLIGRQSGAKVLGFYNRAFQLLMLPINQIGSPATKVALPILSKVQDEYQRFSKLLLNANLFVSCVVIYGLIWVFIQTESIVRIVLGEDWLTSVHFFRILAVAGCFQVLNYALFWVFLSRGLTKRNMIFTLCTRSVLSVAMICMASQGASYIAGTYAVGISLIWPVGLLCLKHFAPVRELFMQGMGLILSGAIAGGITYLLIDWVRLGHGWLSLILSFMVFITLLIAMWLLFPAARSRLIEVQGVLRKSIKRRNL